MINICSSPGSGKTTLMQETGKRLAEELAISVLVGDPETERDAIRMREVGINALQIVTGGMCHIEAQMILQALDHIDLEGVDLLFIENVGNLLAHRHLTLVKITVLPFWLLLKGMISLKVSPYVLNQRTDACF